MSHAGPMTQDKPGIRGKPLALTGLGSSDLVQRRNAHRSKISHQFLRCTRTTNDLAMPGTVSPKRAKYQKESVHPPQSLVRRTGVNLRASAVDELNA